MAHDGTEGLSPDGWLPDRVSVGALTKAFPPELVDRIVETTDTREVRRRLLPARLVVYFVLALWLFRGRNCGYGQVLGKLVDGLYHRRRAEVLLEERRWDPQGWIDAGGGRSWRIPNISSLSRARARLGADPLHMLFGAVAGPVGAQDAAGVFCCGLRVVCGRLHHRHPGHRGQRRVLRQAGQRHRGGGVLRRCGGWRRPSRAPAR